MNEENTESNGEAENTEANTDAATDISAQQDGSGANIPDEFKPEGDADQSADGQSFEYPDGFPDHLKGESLEDSFANLHKAYSGARKTLSEKGSVPESADAYKNEFSDDVKQYFSDEDKPAFELLKQSAHKHGLTDKQYSGLLNDFFGEVLKNNLLDDHVDAAKELASLEPDAKDEPDPARRKAAAQKRVQENDSWIEGFKASNVMSEDEVAELKLLTSTAIGNRVIEKLRSGNNTDYVAKGDPTSHVTQADIDKARKDKRFYTSSQHYDPKFREYWDEQERILLSQKSA